MVRQGGGRRGEDAITVPYIRTSEFLKVLKAPYFDAPYTDVILQNGVYSVKQDLIWVGDGRFDNVISNIAKQMYYLAESGTPLLSPLFKFANATAIKMGCAITFPINLITELFNGALENLKDAKFLGIDVTPEKLDDGIGKLQELLNIDFEGAYGIGIFFSMIITLAILFYAFKLSPSLVPVFGNIIKLFIRIINRIVKTLGRLA